MSCYIEITATVLARSEQRPHTTFHMMLGGLDDILYDTHRIHPHELMVWRTQESVTHAIGDTLKLRGILRQRSGKIEIETDEKG